MQNARKRLRLSQIWQNVVFILNKIILNKLFTDIDSVMKNELFNPLKIISWHVLSGNRQALFFLDKVNIPWRFRKAGRRCCAGARATREQRANLGWLLPVRDIISNLPAFQDLHGSIFLFVLYKKMMIKNLVQNWRPNK